MACYAKITGWYARTPGASGRYPIVFDKARADTARPVEFACGRCIGCRIGRSREWAMRCMHESQLHLFNCFLTLTYDDEHLPAGGTLVKRDVQLWLKRLRERISEPFRYFIVGEYGDTFGRPHYHGLMFGLNFSDSKFFRGSGVSRQERSDLLDETWQKGACSIGTLTSASAQYVTNYSVKKVLGGDAQRAVYGDRLPPFALMSRRPGLGGDWIRRYHPFVLERDFVVASDGSTVCVPTYYMKRCGDSMRMRELKADRRLAVLEAKWDNPDEFGSARLLAKQTVKEVNFARSERERCTGAV